MTHIPGNHGLLDLYGCDEAILKDQGRLKTVHPMRVAVSDGLNRIARNPPI